MYGPQFHISIRNEKMTRVTQHYGLLRCRFGSLGIALVPIALVVMDLPDQSLAYCSAGDDQGL